MANEPISTSKRRHEPINFTLLALCALVSSSANNHLPDDAPMPQWFCNDIKWLKTERS